LEESSGCDSYLLHELLCKRSAYCARGIRRRGSGSSSLVADAGVEGRVVISDVLGSKDVVEGRDGRTDGRFCLLGIGRNGQIL
jgi:hypothetical protein